MDDISLRKNYIQIYNIVCLPYLFKFKIKNFFHNKKFVFVEQITNWNGKNSLIN